MSATTRLGGSFDFDSRAERLEEVERELADPDVWNDQTRAQELSQERASLERIVSVLTNVGSSLSDSSELLDLSLIHI